MARICGSCNTERMFTLKRGDEIICVDCHDKAIKSPQTAEVSPSNSSGLVMPIMLEHGKRWDRTIPFEWLDEAQAQKNHGQTLKRLAERGGLDPSEAIALLNGDPWKPVSYEVGLEILNHRLAGQPKA